MIEKRIYGPPGTGKTTYLSTYVIPEAVSKYGPEKVMVTSFTRAAAKEISSKPARYTTEHAFEGMTIPVPEENVGTLHSICYHALGAPKILETEKTLLQQWNEKYPDMEITGAVSKNVAFDEGGGESGKESYGDQLLSAFNIKRNRMQTNESAWHVDLQRFAQRWRDFKKSTDTVDFTDLIEICLKDYPYAPFQPKVLVVDEAQDFTRLQLKLARSWGADMEELILVGDDDQSIYFFAGSTHDAFLDPPIPAYNKKVLDQSWRVPQLVLERANQLIKRVSRREPKDYHPRRDNSGKIVPGEVIESSSSYIHPEEIIHEARDLSMAGEGVMILASCRYMLNSVVAQLRSAGIPFENKYRRRFRDWNPLYIPKRGTTTNSTIMMLTNFLSMGEDKPYWTVEQFVSWAQNIRVCDSGLKHKVGKKGIEALKVALQNHELGLETTREVLGQLLEPDAVQAALSRDLKWLFETSVKAKAAGQMEYCLRVIKNFGKEAILEQPKLTIGTIHSVKGGQSPHVFLFPDISWQADAEMQMSTEGRDNAYRLFYVGMTRAKERLILCNPSVKYNRQTPRMFVSI